jgi:hypothetical protein
LSSYAEILERRSSAMVFKDIEFFGPGEVVVVVLIILMAADVE